jgi:hypothetical protein
VVENRRTCPGFGDRSVRERFADDFRKRAGTSPAPFQVTPMKKLIWTALVVLSSAAGAALVARLVDLAWRRIVGEPPPEVPRWARLLVSPIKNQVQRSVGP